MKAACLAIALAWAASAGAETFYRLPWADGLSFMFTQVPGGRVTSHFTKATAYAVDVAMPEGMPIVAARDGIVVATEARHGASPEEDPLTYEGNFVRVRHADGTDALYAHLRHNGVTVAIGQPVKTGQLLGYSGATGDVLQAHLHFAVVRVQTNSSGWQEEVSIPVTFYVGAPPVTFSPRAALRITANYSGAVDPPRAPSESSMFPRKLPTLDPGDEPRAWTMLGLWLACGAAGLAWFWRFARK